MRGCSAEIGILVSTSTAVPKEWPAGIGALAELLGVAGDIQGPAQQELPALEMEPPLAGP
jgi:hypothetical protein